MILLKRTSIWRRFCLYCCSHFVPLRKERIYGKHHQEDKNVLSSFGRSIGGPGAPFRKICISVQDNYYPCRATGQEGLFYRKRPHTLLCVTQWQTDNNMVLKGGAACGSWDLYRHRAGFEYVETLEETTAYAISVERLDELYRSYIDLANWMRVLQQENFLRLQDIHIRRLSWSARERYEHLTKECPELFQRVNLGYIASFLGITQQSLSRIRANGRF